MCFMTSPCPSGPHDGTEPEQRRGRGHEFGPYPLGGPFPDGRPQVEKCTQAPLLPGLFIGQVQIEEHEDAGFGIHPSRAMSPTQTPMLML